MRPDRRVRATGREAVVRDLVQRPQQRIDACVARDENTIVGYLLAPEIRSRHFGRRKVIITQDIHETTIHLFRKRSARVAGSEASLDMAKRDFQIKSDKAGRKARRRVALDQDHIRPLANPGSVEPRQETRGQTGKLLVVLHEVQIDIGLNPEDPERLVEQPPMLRRCDD